jgi:hypothetical protein
VQIDNPVIVQFLQLVKHMRRAEQVLLETNDDQL